MRTTGTRRPNVLTAAEVDAYERDGHVTPGFRLAPARVAELRAALEALLAANPTVPPESLMSAHIVDGKAENVRGHQAFLDLALDPAILDMIEQVIGPDIILWSCHVFCKPAGTGREVPWHQDGHFWPFRPLATCTAWLALDHVDTENGCIRMIPGSHRARRLYRHHEDADPAMALYEALDFDQYEESDAINVELEPGQFSLHDIYTIHGSAANRSGRRRTGVALRYMPSTSLFDRGARSRPDGSDSRYANFVDRPIWLARGVDRHGGNDFTIGHG